MTNIKQSLAKIRSASERLQNLKDEDGVQRDLSSVHQVLSDLSNTVESLKEDVNSEQNSPIRFK